MDMWRDQDTRVYLIVEKEALAGVFESVCHEYDVPMLAARGYPSVSVLYSFIKAEGLHEIEHKILHFGDHDPSGIDMTRDLQDRLSLLAYSDVTITRVALNMDQIEQFKPPPNPAKMTDSRFADYRDKFGESSWELDALNPTTLQALATDWIQGHIDTDRWAAKQAEIQSIKDKLVKVKL